eukprot:TRINITY_DN10731_c0_g1_i1.p1 TRINITY_DN10731_c0_g1~~TRINITY_DN10731_c0_g1_i1.p1  ORF type:complete len:287 (-),score=51.95 TRINITY_DN10731_c0_g1_i1:21-881(-)
MQRRLARERKEYIDSRKLNVHQREMLQKKRKLQEYLERGEQLPADLARDALKARDAMRLEDDEHTDKVDVDDEYALAGVEDPRILITTAHDPSQKLQIFAKELSILFPNAKRVNRGSIAMKELLASARANGFSDLITVQESKGVPDGLIIQHLPMGPTFMFTLYNVVTRHDIPDVGPMSEQYPHLLFFNFTTKLGERVKSGLRYLFPVINNPENNRVLSFDNKDDVIAFRHHTFKTDKKNVALTEAGPRFDLKLYQVRLGTLDMPHAKRQWALKSHQRSGKRRRTL